MDVTFAYYRLFIIDTLLNRNNYKYWILILDYVCSLQKHLGKYLLCILLTAVH